MPFEGAINSTGAIVVENVCDLEKINDDKCRAITEVWKANMDGIKHVIWNGKQVDPDTPLEEVLKTTRRYDIVMIPLMPNDSSSPWMQITPNTTNAVRKVIGGGQYYEAHKRVNASLNQVYYVKVLGRALASNFDSVLAQSSVPPGPVEAVGVNCDPHGEED